MEIQNDVQMQRALGLHYMFDSAGFKIFEHDLSELKEYAEGQIQQSHNEGFYTADRLSKLNYDLGRKAGLEMVLNVITQLREELNDKSLAER